MFKPSDKALRYIQFAHFCTAEGVKPYNAAEMVALADRAFKAGERYCNSGSDRDCKAHKAAMDSFGVAAESLGYEVEWPGLWPQITKGGHDVTLPPFD